MNRYRVLVPTVLLVLATAFAAHSASPEWNKVNPVQGSQFLWHTASATWRAGTIDGNGAQAVSLGSGSVISIGSLTALVTSDVGPTGYATDPIYIGALTASSTVVLATGSATIGTVNLSTNTVTLAESSKVVGLATNTVTLANDARVGPDSTSVGGITAGSLPSRPFGSQLYLTDNSGLQAVMTCLTSLLGDGVNGQNMVPIGAWMFNGTSWDRLVGSSTSGVLVSLATNTVTLSGGSVNANVAPQSGANFAVQVDQNRGARTPAVTSWTLDADTPVNIGADLQGYRGFSLNVFHADVLFGASSIATGTVHVGYPVASGTTMTWSGIDASSTFVLYAIGNGGAASVTLGVAW